jgi:hypothetical protein
MGAILGCNAFRDSSRERNAVLMWAGCGLVIAVLILIFSK